MYHSLIHIDMQSCYRLHEQVVVANHCQCHLHLDCMEQSVVWGAVCIYQSLHYF